MLSVKSYSREYIDACRARLDSQLAAYRAVASKRTSTTDVDEAFDVAFFNNLVLTLEVYFLHRISGQEKKNGNPLNEVRVLAASMTAAEDIMTSDSTINLDPAKSILGYAVGDRIALDEQRFVALADAYFAEIEAKFGPQLAL
ncbi:hypothetical protein [Rhodococcus sp. IEGM 1341]|uniref:hypothetical protein n=1 Tax=Rhodococcus sp. IEGM 1341 TaxID=3047090 RepID=UPI0024B71DA3|nr:hypothetical protein [Rhodococcus sp. IEGM 1341]MDI9926378.1 hypothetical protein [Rhodococcus sp. IEGM 1341]